MKTLKEVKHIKTVTLRLSDEDHKDLKRLTVEDEITIQDYITSLIRADAEKRKSENLNQPKE